jgi:tetratricopeptide (TPR) repeat protein
MKTIFSLSATALLLAVPAIAQPAAAPAPAAAPGAPAAVAPQQAPAMLIYDDGTSDNIFVVAATKTAVRFKSTAQAIDTEDLNLSSVQALYLLEPKVYRDAMELYQARKYAEAKDLFAQAKMLYKPTSALDNNYSTLGAFYELECLRRLGDLENLSKALEGFRKDGLTREHHLRQLEVYVFWDAVRQKSWDRLVALGEARLQEKLPSYQRAQIAYCVAQAYEALKQPSKALNAYNTAMVADIGATEEIADKSALAVMRIHQASPEVQLAIKLWKTEDENKNTTGYLHLQEAASVAGLYELTLGGGKKLPNEFVPLLKFKPEITKPEPQKPSDEKPKEDAPKDK